MAKQAQGTEYILMAHPQAQPLVRQYLECTLDHRYRLAIGNPLGRVVQVGQGKSQSTAQVLGTRALVRDHLSEGLQQKWRDQGQVIVRINGFPLHGCSIPD